MLAAGTLLVSAAAALLAVSLVWYARSREPMQAAVDSAAGRHAAGRHVKNSEPRRRRTGGGTLAISHRNVAKGNWSQGEWLVEAPRLPDHLRDSLGEWADTFPESVQRFREVERLAPGIRPLRLSFALVWETLFRALPGVSDETPRLEPSATRPTGCWPATLA